MWRRRGTTREHRPVPPASPAVKPPTGCGRKKVDKKIRAVPHVSQQPPRRTREERPMTPKRTGPVWQVLAPPADVRPRRVLSLVRAVGAHCPPANDPETPRGAPDRSPTPLVGTQGP